MLASQFFGGIALSVEQGHLIEEANLLISNIVGDVVPDWYARKVLVSEENRSAKHFSTSMAFIHPSKSDIVPK